MYILALETSCDETAAAVVQDGRAVLSSVIAAQVDIHRLYGGVVPEIASRNHLRKIIPVLEEALAKAGLPLSQIDGFAATGSPGLIGALLTGFMAIKGIAFALNKPFVAVNHLEGHLAAIRLTPEPPAYPLVALVASGGHTALYHLPDEDTFHLLGHTLDDAAGEALDKTAKLLGLGYPGGPAIEMLARQGNPQAISFPKPLPGLKNLDFSFSGLKTAALTWLQGHGQPAREKERADFCASFQQAVVEHLARKTFNAARMLAASRILVAGGVAANGRLREVFQRRGDEQRCRAYFPPLDLCQDNAAMIAAAAYRRLKRGMSDPLSAPAKARDELGVKVNLGP